MGTPLYELAEEYRALTECDDEELDERLEALGGELNERLERLAAVIRTLELQCSARAEEMQRLRSRDEAEQRRIERLKEAGLNALELAGKKKVQGALFTLTREKGRERVEVPDVEALPPWAIREKREIKRSADKVAITNAMADARQHGVVLQGMHVHDDGSVTVDGAHVVRGRDKLRIR